MTKTDGCKNKKDNCDVLRFYYVLGKKWTYALLYKMNPGREYSFEDFYKFARRKINRTMLSNILKELVYLKLLVKKERKYTLTKKGRKLKFILDRIKGLFIADCKYISEDIKEDCIVNNFLMKYGN
jgi:DNA-binding HxlR family transcriptional regulator